jgi:glycosyltransferase involved in cell wall biosynthesis
MTLTTDDDTCDSNEAGSSRSVLMVTYTFAPSAVVGIFRTLRFAKYLPEFDWSPLVLTVKPESEGRWEQDESLLELIPPETTVFRTGVWNLRAWLKKRRRRSSAIKTSAATSPRPNAKHGLVRRIKDVLLFFVGMPDTHVWWMVPALRKGREVVRSHRPRVLFSTSPPHSTHLIACLLKRLTGLPLVIDFRDPWTRGLLAFEQSGRLRKMIERRLERFCIRTADRVVLNTPLQAEEFQRYYHREPSDKFLFIPNGFDPELVSRIKRLSGAPDEADVGQAIRLCHAGSVYAKRDLRPILVAMRQLIDAGQHIVLQQIGPVNNLAETLEEVERLRLADVVEFIPYLSQTETLERVATCTIPIVLRLNSAGQVPAKLYETLLFRKPILGLAESGDMLSRYMTEYSLGPLADPDDAPQIAEAIMAIHRRYHSWTDHADWERAQQAFDGRRLTGELAKIFVGLVDERALPAMNGARPAVS